MSKPPKPYSASFAGFWPPSRSASKPLSRPPRGWADVLIVSVLRSLRLGLVLTVIYLQRFISCGAKDYEEYRGRCQRMSSTSCRTNVPSHAPAWQFGTYFRETRTLSNYGWERDCESVRRRQNSRDC